MGLWRSCPLLLETRPPQLDSWNIAVQILYRRSMNLWLSCIDLATWRSFADRSVHVPTNPEERWAKMKKLRTCSSGEMELSGKKWSGSSSGLASPRVSAGEGRR